ncbi:glycosyltransferase [Coleofasciculus sp. FACHB-T130]|uniref:glycosyltransferase n=1 Tax=Cyanophyceae TaxID=3028117 RepID=UPI001682D4CF|nr:glycosyltransferase [Coleofasciculus sp. FACHB-T130]MBD1879841.1 glycosyltransferase family 1 protein [Coleofasciculus sp. FACHB-T130]
MKIVLHTYGSLGDLHPYIAIALELKARGYQAVIATAEFYRNKIEAAGLEFHPVRPDFPTDVEQQRELVRLIMDKQNGTEYVFRQAILPYVQETYEDLMSAVRDAELLVTHPLSFAATPVVEKTGIRWVSSVLSPMSFLSAYDPPVVATFPSWLNLRILGPGFNGALIRLAKNRFSSWDEPLRQLRTQLGLSPLADSMFEGMNSPDLVLALFSEALATPQPDWPKQTCVTGFTFYDRNGNTGLSPELASFLDAGDPPIVFTLGSSAVWVADKFYLESAKAALKLGYRAVLLVGNNNPSLPKELQSKDIGVFDYAPYSELFHRAAAIVHQGGVGTTAQVLRSGRPMLVVPFSNDQPDNAARITRLGVGRTIDRDCYTASRAAKELDRLLREPRYQAKAAEVGNKVRAENGVKVACDAIEAQLKKDKNATNLQSASVSPV